MVGSLLRFVGWVALACSVIVSCTAASASAASADASRSEVDEEEPVQTPGKLRVRFDFVPSHDGIRTVVLDESSGRRTPIADLPEGASCEITAEHGEGDANGRLELRCGSGLQVSVFADGWNQTLGIRGTYDFLSDAPWFGDDLPIAPRAILDADGILNDPAPPPSCSSTSEQSVELRLEHVAEPKASPYAMEEIRLHASFGPIDAHVETPGCDRTCVSKGDATGHHYAYVCSCTWEPFEWSMQVHVRNRTVYAYEVQSMPDTGIRDVKGRWSVPCGAHLRYPAGTEIVALDREADDYLEPSTEETRRREEAQKEKSREWGLDEQ
jgi:hypothetical protein